MKRFLMICALIFVCCSALAQTNVTPLYSVQVNSPYPSIYLGVRVNGVFPFTFKVSEGSLPEGLALSEQGLLSGTANKETSGAAVFTVTVTDATGAAVAKEQFSIVVAKTPPVIVAGSKEVGAVAPSTEPAAKSVPPAPITAPAFQGDNKVRGSASPEASVEITRGREKISTTADANGTFEAPLGSGKELKEGEEFSAVQTVAGAKSLASKTQPVQGLIRGGEQARVILGYQQAGASAAQSNQNWFLDFYISRPLWLFERSSGQKVPDPRLRWWGNVRVASYPQQGDVPVSTFVSSFAAQFGQLRVNQLVQSAEFTTGFEYRISNVNFPFLGQSEETKQRFSLGLIAGLGATGPFDPKSTVQTFAVPNSSSPQFARFVQNFPQAAASQYVAFVSPDRDQFLRQYFAGFRLTTRYADKNTEAPLIAAPASVSFTVGQNELVTGGRFRGPVARIEAFYPLPFSDRSADRRGASALASIYLFGNAQMRLSQAKNIDPFVLQPAPSTVNPYDPNVAVVTVPSNRDLYRLGIGIDFVHLLTSLKGTQNPQNPNPTPGTPAPQSDAAEKKTP